MPLNILLRSTRVSNREEKWILAGGNGTEKAHGFGMMVKSLKMRLVLGQHSNQW